MVRKALYSVAAVLITFGVTACERGDDTEVIARDTVGTTVPGRDTVQRPVIVPDPDTIAVERTVEVERDTIVDTRP